MRSVHINFMCKRKSSMPGNQKELHRNYSSIIIPKYSKEITMRSFMNQDLSIGKITCYGQPSIDNIQLPCPPLVNSRPILVRYVRVQRTLGPRSSSFRIKIPA